MYYDSYTQFDPGSLITAGGQVVSSGIQAGAMYDQSEKNYLSQADLLDFQKSAYKGNLDWSKTQYKKNLEWEREQYAGNRDWQREQYTGLMDWQKEQYERNRAYDLEQLGITREREDTAVQRRVADLKAAGLSPTLAAGSAATTVGANSQRAPSLNAPPGSTAPSGRAPNLPNPTGMSAPEKNFAQYLHNVMQPMEIAAGTLGLLRQQKEIASLDKDIEAKNIANEYNASANPMKTDRMQMENYIIDQTLESTINTVHEKYVQEKWKAETAAETNASARLQNEYDRVRNKIQNDFGYTGAKLDLFAKDVALKLQNLKHAEGEYNYGMARQAGVPTNQAWTWEQKLGSQAVNLLNNLFQKQEEYIKGVQDRDTGYINK